MVSTPSSPGSPSQRVGSNPSVRAPDAPAGSTPAMPASASPTWDPNVNLSEDELIRSACEKVSESIFHVKFEKRDRALIEDHIQELIRNLPDEQKASWTEKMEEILDANTSEFTTGFVVGEGQDFLFILTCVHALQACYNASHPLSITSVRNMFRISVRCDHEESTYDGRAARQYIEAHVYKMDTRKDMLLLRVRTQCSQTYPTLKIADSLPGRLAPVGMVSWPFDRHRTTVKGAISHNSRVLKDFNDDNEHGYNFSAIEVNITSDGGSSGAPGVDIAARVIGMLHGGNVDCVSYFISMDDIASRLTSWGVMRGASGTSGSKVGTSGTKTITGVKRSAC